MLYYPISALINAITSLVLGFIAIRRNPRTKLKRVFTYFSLSVTFWSWCYFGWQISNTYTAALFWSRALMIGAIFVAPTIFHLSVTLVGQNDKYKDKIKLWYGIFSIFALLDFTHFFVKEVHPRLFFPYWPSPGITYTPFLFLWICLSAYSLILMFKFYKELSGIQRNQVKYVFLGTVICFIGGSTNYFLWYDIPIPPVGNILVSVYVIMVFYAIHKYRLMDIAIALTRTGTFAVVYALVLGLPFVFIKWLKPTLVFLLGENWWIAILVFGMALASAGPFVFMYLQRRAENTILKEQRRYQEIVKNLSKTMIGIRELKALLDTISSTITKEVKVECVGIYLKEEEYKSFHYNSCYPGEAKPRFQEFIPLDHALINAFNLQKRPLLSEEIGVQDRLNLDSGLLIPCFGKDGLLAIIILGAKPKNQMYSNDDILTFENLSYDASLAIENCTYWKEIENRQRMARIEEMHSFSYSVAHEIDNPMTIIIRGIDVLIRDYIGQVDDEADKKRLVDLLNFMHEAAWRVSGMVKAVQEFGQKASSELKPIKFEKVIDTFLNLYLPHFKMNGVVFTKEVPKEPYPLIRGISQEIEQTLLILAKNAVQALQFTKEKKIHLKAEIINSDWIRITLTDNGPGIAKEKLLSIFTAFYTTKGTNEGTGMGLFNATKFIVERHKGKLWAESEGPGKGASFIIELPIAKDIQPEELKEERKSNITKFN